MSDEQLLVPYEIDDQGTRHDVVLLQAEFPNETLESCYFWYLYHHGDFDAIRSQLDGGFPEMSVELTIDANPDETSSESVSLGVFPAEIWQIVSSHLTFRDLSTLRLTNSVLADVAAESMLQTVRFDLSFESLERLRFIAGHPHLRKGVKSLVFEAGLIARLGCIHHYSSHYDLEHHKDTQPQPPTGSLATPQAQRLYARNLAKFQKELDAKYAVYRKSFEAQERLLNGPKDFLFRCLDQFPNVTEITLATNQCRHLLSQRFVERYGQDCAVGLTVDPSQTPWELQSILRPGIKRLNASQISPKCFDGEDGRSRKWLESTFKDLTYLALQIRHDASSEDHEIASMLRNTNLSYAIGTATNLEELIVNFSTVLPVGQLKDIFPPGKSFQRLHDLNIESFTATEDEVIGMLESQPALKNLYLADVSLSTGSWRELLKRMRDNLDLKYFSPGGVLSDNGIDLYTDHYSTEAWQDGDRMPLSVAIEIYVTDDLMYSMDDEEEFETAWNPVNQVEFGDYMSYDDLVDEFGPIDDSDSDDDLDDSDDDDSDDEDSDIDSDAESMHTANEAMNENNDERKDVEGLNNDSNSVVDSDDDLPDLEDQPSPMHLD